MIKQSTIDSVLQVTSIVDILGDFIDLTKKGVNYTTCCPFHNEKTPSFIVSPARNSYHCFGCGESGDSIKFLEKQKHFTFPEAIRFLADKYNITVSEEKPDPERAKKISFQAELIKFNEFASGFFRSQLEEDPQALTYASDRFSGDTIVHWQLGLAIDSFNSLLEHSKKQGYKDSFLLKTGLIKQSDKGNLYDFFRNRLMFPIFDKSGRIISFSGRILPYSKNAADYGKYLNLSQTPLYSKSHVLYGLNFAIQHMVKHNTAILVEGNPDVVKLHELNISNTVAPCGTALTTSQVSIIKRFARDIILLFDGDKAGHSALIKNGLLTIESGLDTYMAIIPKDEDPDTFFTSQKHFSKWYSENKIDFVSYYSNFILKNIGEDPIKKNRAVQDISKLLFHITPNRRTVYIDSISKKHNIKSKLFLDELKNLEPTAPKEDLSHAIPDGVSIADYEKWGFYEYNNQYYFRTKNGKEKLSNFTMKPIFHVESFTDSRRIYELKNNYGYRITADFDMTEMTSLQSFARHVEGKGNFLFYGSSAHFNKLKLKLYEETKTCVEIKNLGWQNEGFFAWSNGLINGSGFEPVDENGIIKHNDINYFIPAFSRIYVKDMTLYKDERKFKFIDRKIALHDWTHLFTKVFGENAKVAIAFWIATLFRDHILYLFNNFPILNLFGPKGSGKSQMAMSMSCLFGQQQTPFNIHNGTKPGLAEHIQLFRNAFAWIDEYKNNIEYDKIETLKSIYDAIGRSRLNIDKGLKKETTNVNAGVILSGQEMPTADVALFSRVIFLRFNKSEFTDEEKRNYDSLKSLERSGLSHFSSQILQHRKFFIDNYYEYYLTTLADLQDNFKDKPVEDRLLRNMTSILAAFKTLSNKFDFGFSYEDLLSISVSIVRSQNWQMSQSNEIGQFWNIFEYMFDENHIVNNWHFRVDPSIKLNTITQDYQFGETKMIFKFKYNAIYSLYAKHARTQGVKPLPSDTLQYYLKNHKLFLGVQKACHFKFEEFDKEQGQIVKRSQTTSAYCFDYSNLGINMERSDEKIERNEPDQEPDNRTESNKQKIEDGLPF